MAVILCLAAGGGRAQEAPGDTQVVEGASLSELDSMSLEKLLEQQVVVTSSQQKTTVREAPAAIYAVTDKQIEERGYQTVEEVLADLPGFDIVHVYGTWPDLVHQRGLPGNNQRTLLYVDGVLDNNIFEGAILGGSLRYPLANVKRVEVLSGPASALYGANAFNGVINIITKQGDEDPGYGAEATFASWDQNLSSVGIGGSATARGTYQVPSLGALSYSVSAQGLAGGGPRFGGVQSADWGKTLTSDGTPVGYFFSPLYDSSKIATWNVTASFKLGAFRLMSENWVYHQGQGTFANGNQHVDSDQFPLANPTLTPNGTDWSFQENKLVAGYTAQLARTVSADTELNFRHTVVLNPGSDIYPNNNINAGPAYLDDPNDLAIETNWYREDNGVEIKEHINWDPEPRLNAKLGVEGYRQWVPYDYALYNPQNQRHAYNNLAVFGQTIVRPLPTLSLIGGYRFDDHTIYGQSSTPRLGAVFTPTEKLTLKALLGTGFRGPTAWEVTSTTAKRRPNPNLTPEKLQSLEAGIGYRFSPRYYVAATTYWNNIQDLIINDVPMLDDPTHNQNRNAGNARVIGVEAQADARVTDWLDLYGNATFDHGYFTSLAMAPCAGDPSQLCDSLRPRFVTHDGSGALSNQLPTIAPWKANLGATWTPLSQLSANLRVQVVSSRRNIATDPVQSVPGFALLHLNLRLHDALYKGLFFDLAIHNLLDQQVFDPGIRNAKGTYYPTQMPVERMNVWFGAGVKL